VNRLHSDVVCFGGGGTGLAAAVTAAANGARVVVLEKRHTVGGNSRLGTGIFAADSVVQERHNIRAPRDEMFRVTMEYARWELDPRLVRAWIDRSAEIVSWLESLGVRWEWVPSLPFGQFPPTWHCPVDGGPAIIDALLREARRLGVDIRLETAAHTIRRDEGGAVAGVDATTRDGAALQVDAPAVVVGSGGFGGNHELLRRFRPDFDPSWHLLGIPNAGEGIEAAHAAGAAQEGMGNLQFEAPATAGALFLNLILREPRALLINRQGRRFMDEGLLENPFESANALLRQPGAVSYTVLDREAKDAALLRQQNMAAGPVYEAQARKPERFARQLAALDRRRGIIASDLEEVAEYVGADPAAVHATVDEYNAACDRGHDPLFAKERRYLMPVRTPPYWILEGRPGFLETIGGIRIDERMRVIQPNGQPIEGLWAGGADTGGWETDTYCFKTAGKTFSFALVSGRIAGEQAARMV
jgi:fumarate reductase flavoprotein subunit